MSELNRRKFLAVIGASGAIASSSLVLGAGSAGLSRGKEHKSCADRTFGSISELRQLSGGTREIVYVLGYHGARTPGGGEFCWDKESVEDDDGGAIIRPSAVEAGEPGRWRRIYMHDPISPDIYGAKKDGVADDSQAVRNALLFVERNIGFSGLFFPSGTYNLKTWKTLSSKNDVYLAGENVTLKGNGEDFLEHAANLHCIGLKFRDFGMIFRIGNSGKYLDSVFLDRVEVTECENLLFWTEGGPNTGARNISVTECTGRNLRNRFVLAQPAAFELFTVDRCTIENVDSHGILIGNNTTGNFSTRRNILITNNIIRGVNATGAGIGRSEGDRDFTKGRSETQGILLYGHRTLVSGNLVKDIGLAKTGDAEGVYTKCLYVTVSNNTFVDAGGRPDGFLAIKDYRAESEALADQRQEYNVVIEGNTFKSRKEVGVRAISCQKANAHIIGNKFVGKFSSSSYVVRLYGLLDSIKLIGNEFLLKDFSDGRKNIGCVRATRSTSNFIFSSNYLENWAQSGVIIEGRETQWVTINHNQFRDCGGKDTQSRPLSMNGARLIRGILIQGNVVERMRRGFFHISVVNGGTGAKVIIKDNIFDKIAEKEAQLPALSGFVNVIMRDNVLDE